MVLMKILFGILGEEFGGTGEMSVLVTMTLTLTKLQSVTSEPSSQPGFNLGLLVCHSCRACTAQC